jgi:hypothetical protein
MFWSSRDISPAALNGKGIHHSGVCRENLLDFRPTKSILILVSLSEFSKIIQRLTRGLEGRGSIALMPDFQLSILILICFIHENGKAAHHTGERPKIPV